MTVSSRLCRVSAALALSLSALPLIAPNAQAQNRPNVVMLMTDDTGWNDFGAYRWGREPRPSDAEHRPHRPRKAPCSRVGMARRVAPPAAPRS